jgi:hypothetical protein
MIDTHQQSHDHVPDPQGYFWRVPYDWRRPTWARFRARWWNPADPRFFTPRCFGCGWDFNLYWMFHSREFRQAHWRS